MTGPGDFRLIRVSAQVFKHLQELAEPGETPDTVLRRVLGLPERPQGRRSSVLKPYENEAPA